jgi:pimeloyl-ACP methyl ester carboxylesterase
VAEDQLQTRSAETPLGAIEFVDVGAGDPVLFVHGSPGGWDEGELMTRFLVAAGFRAICPSRPGYLGTPLTEENATPDAQAEMAVALVDSLGIGEFGVMCWSGGGPCSYRLTVNHPDRVRNLVAVAAVSTAYTFEHDFEESLLGGHFGRWLVREMARHAPKSLVKSTLGAEGDLSKEQLRELTETVFDDDARRDFVVSLAVVVAGRKRGLDNDRKQFPAIGDLELGRIRTPTLLVHGDADSDVPPVYSNDALAAIDGAQLLRVEHGTHIAAWTDPTCDSIQARITGFLRTGELAR